MYRNEKYSTSLRSTVLYCTVGCVYEPSDGLQLHNRLYEENRVWLRQVRNQGREATKLHVAHIENKP